MCGIVGAINHQSVTEMLVEGLERLSYRGYDSAGVAVSMIDKIKRRRAKGKVSMLRNALTRNPLEGTIGIAHTRWATHGQPDRKNAHPHMSDKVAVVHNGIVENYGPLRAELEARGHRFKSETDSEVIPHLITDYLNAELNPQQAMREAMNKLHGSYAIAVMFKECNSLFAARHGSPLVIGIGEQGHFVASDANAIGDRVSHIIHLENGDLAQLRQDSVVIYDDQGDVVQRLSEDMQFSNETSGKNGYRHYMLKEIHEQPDVIGRTVAQYLDEQHKLVESPMLDDLAKVDRMNIVACGTSYYAGMIGKHWFETLARKPVDIDVASEFRYRDAPLSPSDASLFISQSGETADTLAAMEYAAENNQQLVSIVNVAQSTMERISDVVLHTRAGIEIGVASTKAFTSQLAVLLGMALSMARAENRIDTARLQQIIEAIQSLPAMIETMLQDDSHIEAIARSLRTVGNMLYLGRGVGYPLAQEGALKLKEISYIHAEAYPAGELKHGPIALVDEDLPVVFIAQRDQLFKKSLSNLREVASRGAKIILISDREGIEAAGDHVTASIEMPEVDPVIAPFIYSIPLQLLAYHVALVKGTDVDQPRNLAKSVTVE